MATVTKPLALDESIKTTEQTPRNVADVLAQGLDAIGQAIASGSGSGGHVIEDTNGTALTQRADLQFVGVYTEDDSANDRTKVNVVRTMTKAQMDALSAAEKVGFIRTSDEADNPYQGIQIYYKDCTIAGSTTSSYELSIPLGVFSSDYIAISFIEISPWSADYTVSLLCSANNEFRVALRSKASSYTVPSSVGPVRVFFVKANCVNPTPLP